MRQTNQHKDELPILAVFDGKLPRIPFDGHVSVDCVQMTINVRDRDGGLIKIEPSQVDDLVKFLLHAKSIF